MQPAKALPTAFLHSKYFYAALLIAFAGAQVDWVLTAFGLVLGYSETRPFFWLHAVALFAVIILVHAFFYARHPKITNYVCLAFAITSPAIPIISNAMTLATGSSPFL
jgi:hypothetical protein